jgi:hypothetical protein
MMTTANTAAVSGIQKLYAAMSRKDVMATIAARGELVRLLEQNELDARHLAAVKFNLGTARTFLGAQ